jgi:hypothetical protein
MKSPTKREMRALEALAYLQAGIPSSRSARAAQRGLAEELFPAGTIHLCRSADSRLSNLGHSNTERPKFAVSTCARPEQVDQCGAAPAPQSSTLVGAACAALERVALSGRSPTEPPEVAIAWERATIRLFNACERLTRSIEILMGASGIDLIPAVRRFVDDGIVFLNDTGNCGVDRCACEACSVSRRGGSSNDALPSR